MLEIVDEASRVLDESLVNSLHDIGSRMAAADPLHEVLEQIVTLIVGEIECDSCFIYILDGDELVLQMSKNSHPEAIGRLKLHLGQGITGWVAKHKQPVALPENAFRDPRFKFLSELPEDRYEAFLSVPILCHGRLVGVINLQHRAAHKHTSREIKFVSMIGFLVGAEIERARLQSEVSELSAQLEVRKLVERAKGILQRDLQLTEEEAYRSLQRQSRQMRRSMREVAEAVMIIDDLKRSQAHLPASPPSKPA
jgi:signal transduction protein with GAF and PtsI domain